MEEAARAARAAVLRLGSLACLACAHVLDHVAILPHSEGEETHRQPRHGPPEVSAKRSIVALAENLRPQVATRRNAQPVCCALATAVQLAAPH